MSPSGEGEPKGTRKGGRSEAEARARDAAFRLLAVRPRTVVEMKRRLGGKRFSAPVVAEVVSWLLERDLLDDEAFARQFLEDRLRRRPRGPFALIRELEQRGVRRSQAERVLAGLMADREIEEEDIARDTARRWLSRQPPDTAEALTRCGPGDEAEKARSRLYAHLERKGFRRQIARTVVDEVRDGTIPMP